MVRFVTPQRLKDLQTAIGFLNEFTAADVVVGKSSAEPDLEKTATLRELARTNKLRIKLIGKLLDIPTCDL